jgi:amidase
MNDVAWLDATAQAELVRKKQIKPSEFLDGAIERIERLNPEINAVVTKMYDEAKKSIDAGLPEGPFTGVPFLLKDLSASYAGARQTSGSRFCKDYVSPVDSVIVQRHKAAGLVICGKTNTPEYGLLPTTESELLGAAKNPWNTGRSTGGSSGGAGAAVASGMVPMAHASDGGGSIRIPASCNGVFGVKPTRARISSGPLVGDVMNGLTNEHAETRSVRDSAALLDATRGAAPGDPYVAPEPERPYLQEVGANPGKLRIAFTKQTPLGLPLHPDCIAAVEDAAALCEELGHHVEEAAPNVAGEQLVPAFTALWSAGNAWTIKGMAMAMGKEPKEEDFEILTWAMYQQGLQVSASDYLLAISALQFMSRQIAAWFSNYDVWLTPTLGAPPVELGWITSTPEEPMRAFTRAADWVPYTPIMNVTGQPAMSVPLYWNGEGLPIGTHFAAPYNGEATLFRLAAQLEEARPWSGKRPPVAA